MKLGDLSEAQLVSHFRASFPAGERTLIGIGDDCAQIATPEGSFIVTTDVMVEDQHFHLSWSTGYEVGARVAAQNLADIDAMGGRPSGLVASVVAPRNMDADIFLDVVRGLGERAREVGAGVVGGDLSAGDKLVFSVTAFGYCPGPVVRRDGARVGDAIWVSGPLGAAALAVARRSQGQPVPDAAARRLDWPEPRLAAGLGLAGVASAAMDISDGLAGDLGHLLTASGRRQGLSLGAELWEDRLPLDPVLRESGVAHDEALQLALHGGDDYELLFTAPTAQADTILQCWPDARMIGRIVAESAMLLVDAKGQSRPLAARGHDHFST